MSKLLGRGAALALAAGVVAACGGTPAVAEVRTAPVTRGSVTQTVAVSGSVSSAGTVKLNPPVNGKVGQLFVAVGQQVTAGQPLARLDTTDLQAALTTAQNNSVAAQTNYDSAVATAQNSVVAAQTSYDKAVAGVKDAQSSLTQTQVSVANDIAIAQTSLAKLRANFASAETTFATLSTSLKPDVQAYTSNIDGARIQLQQVINDMSQRQSTDVQAARNSLYGADTSLVNAQSYAGTQLTSALNEFASARDLLASAIAVFDATMAAGGDTASASATYQSALSTYTGAASRLSAALDAPAAAISSAQSAVTSAQQSINSVNSRSDGYLDQARADFVGLQSQLTSEAQLASAVKARITQVNTSITTMTDAITGSLASAIQNVTSAQTRATQSIQNAQTVVNNQPANVQTAQNGLASAQTSLENALANQGSLANAQTNLFTAQTNLENANIKATVAGVVVSISAQPGENVTTSSNTGFIVLANTGSMALHGTVGEADVVKLKLGQVATITVDAVGTAKMTGKVTSLDPVATIASGVPVYGVDVTLDLPGAQVKPGMSGTAQVILASRPNTLVVPNLAVKTQTGRRYLTLLKDGQQVDEDVTFGISNETVTEVLTGAQEGDVVVLPQPRAAQSGGANRGVQIGGGGGNGVPGR